MVSDLVESIGVWSSTLQSYLSFAGVSKQQAFDLNSMIGRLLVVCSRFMIYDDLCHCVQIWPGPVRWWDVFTNFQLVSFFSRWCLRDLRVFWRIHENPMFKKSHPSNFQQFCYGIPSKSRSVYWSRYSTSFYTLRWFVAFRRHHWAELLI